MSSSNEQFIQAWLEHSSAKEVARALKINVSGVYARVRSLRRRGVNLPDKVVLRLTEDKVESLNKMIAEFKSNGHADNQVQS